MTTPTESISVDIIASKVKFWLIVILSLLLILTLIKKFNKFAQKIPTLKNYELVKRLIGSAGLFFKAILGDNHATFRFMVSFYSQFKDTPADIFLGLLHLVYIDKPDDIQVVLNNSNALDKGGAYRLVEKYFGNGLITASADKWKKTRRLVAPYFGTKFMESNFNEFNSHNSDFVEKMRIFCDTHEYVDLWKHVSKLTLTIVWELVLGKDMDTTQQEKDIFLYNADK